MSSSSPNKNNTKARPSKSTNTTPPPADEKNNHNPNNPETTTTALAQRHDRLRAHPVLFSLVGVSHTLLTAGVVFGWASLLAVLRQEGGGALENISPSQFASIFTHGAVGNYLSSLPMGLVLDNCGPRLTGMVASLLFAAGLLLCSFASTSVLCLDAGFTLLGFAGPAIQLPTLHLARLFPGGDEENGSGGGAAAAALLMSAQAGAFDGGTCVFAIFAALHGAFGVRSRTFFRWYALVPLYTLLTAVFYWPDAILPDSETVTTDDDDDMDHNKGSYVGRSPYLSPAASLNLSISSSDKDNNNNKKISIDSSSNSKERLVDAPLPTVLSRPPFYCLALWVGVHILKLNFVVATINDQLAYALPDSPDTVNALIAIFGAMLPFGFVVLPGVAHLLGGRSSSALACFQLANAVGVLYGAVLTFAPGVASFQILVVFASVATSRQLVYSTVFHQTGELFGFCNYGVILGLINVVVSSLSLVQTPLVRWAERARDYTGANAVLLLATLPLFLIVYWTAPPPPTKASASRTKLMPPRARQLSVSSSGDDAAADEESRLIANRSPHLSHSYREIMT